MRWTRAAVAMITFGLGLFTLAGGLMVAAFTFLIDIGHPLDLSAVIGGLVAMGVGIGLLSISRAVGGEEGPVKSYRQRPKRRRVT